VWIWFVSCSYIYSGKRTKVRKRHGVFTVLLYVELKSMNTFHKTLRFLMHCIFTTEIQLYINDITQAGKFLVTFSAQLFFSLSLYHTENATEWIIKSFQTCVRSSCKVSVHLSDCNWTWTSSQNSVKTPNMKYHIDPCGGNCSIPCRQDSWADVSNFIITFHNCLQIHLILVQPPFDFMVFYA